VLGSSSGDRQRDQRVQVGVDKTVDDADGGEPGALAVGGPLPKGGHVGAGYRGG
jgi:hypothetical protein